MQEENLEKTNELLKSIPEINKIVRHNIEGFIEVVNSDNYRGMQRRFGKGIIKKIMDYHIKKENYQECIKIRDRWKRKKTTGN